MGRVRPYSLRNTNLVIATGWAEVYDYYN